MVSKKSESETERCIEDKAGFNGVYFVEAVYASLVCNNINRIPLRGELEIWKKSFSKESKASIISHSNPEKRLKALRSPSVEDSRVVVVVGVAE